MRKKITSLGPAPEWQNCRFLWMKAAANDMGSGKEREKSRCFCRCEKKARNA
jgi:hypothetical protein